MTRGSNLKRWWWPLVAGGVVVLFVGLVIGRATATTTESTGDDEAPRARTASVVLDPGALLGSIEGASRYTEDDEDRYLYAWPGQILTSPEPSTGEAVAWQWETCDVPPEPDEDDEREEPPPLDCTAVEAAADQRWESPPTNRVRLVRVTVTVDLGDQVLIQALSVPVAAVPWPDDITPGDPPPETIPDDPPPASR